ncbi:HigA family addiction module antitoxin [Limnobacter sp.]|uniref:HigA family addiction module antitoxin n=1 Tax=Limnobacter sp. TaxID=2003368 RepID=UPI0025C0EC07|nr:HigA family addiction module antitoxin [Limnobacter sp.]
MNARMPAEVFPPGDFLREELEERGWSQQELADILDRPARLISELISGKRAITPETARGLADAFGTSAEYWMGLESQYQLSRVRTPNDNVARKAKLYSRFPVREMIRRGWVRFSENLDVLEQQFYEFFCINSIEDELGITHYAKKTDTHSEATPLQIAWLYRVRALAAQQRIPKYSREKLLLAVEKLKAMILAPEEVRHVSRTLSEAGVRLVFVEALPGSKLDGACLWLDEDKPVIGMTLRFDRIDNFWFVLRHEIEHVLQEDGKNGEPVIDIEVGEEPEDISQSEMNANIAGANFCVPADQLENFIARVSPYFSEQKVLLFAQRINVHPGLVVGQLQRRLKRHDFLRKHQVKVRALILPYADVDGWGSFSE